MKSFNTLVLATAFAAAASTAFAQTEVPNTFESGEAASASEVNANFSALVSAIDALADRVADLESDVDSLDPTEVTLSDLVGTNYCISSFGNIGAGGGSWARIGSYVSSHKLAITSTTTATLTTVQDDEFELGWGVGYDTDYTLDSELEEYSHDDGGSVTINSLTNGVLSLSVGDFNLSPNGNMILGTEFDFGSGEGEANIVVGMRCY